MSTAANATTDPQPAPAPVEPEQRCFWAGSDPLMQAYHDHEWGVPCHDDRDLYERLMLECFQAGLSWQTILRRRHTLSAAFEGWDPQVVAQYGEVEATRLLADPGIIRNRLKVAAATRNARAFLDLQAQHGSFDAWLWNWVDGVPVRRTDDSLPATTPLSDSMSKALKKAGFTFVGSTIVYAFLQSVGVVDDHEANCFRYHGRTKTT